jgi:hypothetical protein
MTDAFLRESRERDPEAYAALEERYPTLTRNAWRTAQRREQPVGLLGLAPSFISLSVAQEYGLESVYQREDACE